MEGGEVSVKVGGIEVAVLVKVAEGMAVGVNVWVAVKVAVWVGVCVKVGLNVMGWKGVNETVAVGVMVSVAVLVMLAVGVGVMVLVKICGVTLAVGESGVPVSEMVNVRLGVGVAFPSGARERAIKPTQ